MNNFQSIVKSLFPFFTEDTIHFEKALLGSWTDNKKGEWIITSLKEKIETENKNNKKDIAADSKALENYIGGYYIERTHKNIRSPFLAVPFKLDNQLFIDFIPFSPEYEFDEISDLVRNHFVTAHSLAKIDIDNNTINLKWFDSDKLEKLLEEKKIKIDYAQTIDFPNSYLLTASSEDLQKFIKKYMSSDEEDKWGNDVKFTLKK